MHKPMANSGDGADKRADVVRLTQLVAIAVVASAGIGYAFDESRAGTRAAAVGIALTYLVLAVGAVVYGLRHETLWRWLVPRWGDVTRGFFTGLVLFACAFGFVKLIAMHDSPRAAGMARLYLQLGDTKFLRLHQGWVGFAILVMATLEELVWRGWALSLIEDLTSRRAGWVLSGPLYALAHAPTLWALADPTVGKNPVVIIGALGAGWVWAGMARLFGRLGPGIICHALFDWAVLIMFRLWGPSV